MSKAYIVKGTNPIENDTWMLEYEPINLVPCFESREEAEAFINGGDLVKSEKKECQIIEVEI